MVLSGDERIMNPENAHSVSIHFQYDIPHFQGYIQGSLVPGTTLPMMV